MGDTAVPVLSTHDLARTLEFWRTLGYTVTHEQHKPYVYGALRAHDCEIHYYAAPATGHDRQAQETAGCLIMVDDVAGRHRDFTAALRDRYGKVPAKGFGRITRFRPGQTRFSTVDPDGNWITYIQVGETEDVEYGGSAELSGLAKVLDNARILRDFKVDHQAAERALEAGLRRHGAEASRIERARAYAALAELAVALENPAKAEARRADLEQMQLSESERTELATEFDAADDLATWLDPDAG
ncbi:glyoxalase [Nocardia carnea]|uniref:glyoxalase n=1 Tax=Nocardia carnea TaxID=37328 RepID=UPI002455F74F|nr:glyoxalase [Nocardia carnea]